MRVISNGNQNWETPSINTEGRNCYQCESCRHTSAIKTELRRRIRSEHLHTCRKCETIFKQHPNLRSHQHKHRGEKFSVWILSSYICYGKGIKETHKCNKWKNNFKQQLSCHQRKHRGDKLYKCSSCWYTSAKKTILKIHIGRLYCNMCLYQCSNCENNFIQNQNWATTSTNTDRRNDTSVHSVQHQHKHRGVKLHKCILCQYTSTIKLNWEDT